MFINLFYFYMLEFEIFSVYVIYVFKFDFLIKIWSVDVNV